ncbi:MAG: hypothetical protein CML99_16505 [Rhodobiaceae bacterium]|nr:hypothetical protein [Rhodobiaceae bacterium]|tara:strand:- start:997 stop:1407 length:411 start_codon:yes stop_codon:yes gene_type:complete
MCFNKSKSASSQATNSTTVNRDERLAATEGSTITSAKDGSSAYSYVYNYDLSGDVVRDALGFNFETTEEAFGFARGIFDAAIDAVDDVNDRSNKFVSATQAQFAASRETDTKQLMDQLVKVVAITAAGFVAYKVMR